jgi:hypothetical protein
VEWITVVEDRAVCCQLVNMIMNLSDSIQEKVFIEKETDRQILNKAAVPCRQLIATGTSKHQNLRVITGYPY